MAVNAVGRIERQNLPVTLAGLLQKIYELKSGRAEITDTVRGRQRRDMQ
jgi:hypothetical protein